MKKAHLSTSNGKALVCGKNIKNRYWVHTVDEFLDLENNELNICKDCKKYLKKKPKTDKIKRSKKRKNEFFKFYLLCPRCVEPQTSLEVGDHTHLLVTAVMFGAGCQVVARCTACGFTKDISDSKMVIQSSKNDLDEALRDIRVRIR